MEKRKTSSYFIILILVLVFSVSHMEAQTLQKVVSNHAAKYISENYDPSEKWFELKRSRKIVTGDLDKDGDKDVAVFIVLESAPRNSWEFLLAVFENRKGKYKFLADEQVGGRFIGDYKLISIKNDKILGTMECQDNQSWCEGETRPKWNVKFELVNRKLQLVK